MKISYKILLSALLLSVSCFALADSGTSSDKIPDNGVYIQGKAGVGTNNELDAIFESGRQANFTPIVNLGYQFNRYFALEGRYQYISRDGTSVTGSDATHTDNQVTANIKGILPFFHSFNAFAAIGAGADFSRIRSVNIVGATSVDNTTRFIVPISVGLDYNFSQHVAWTIISFDGNLNHFGTLATFNRGITSVTTGLKYTF